MGLALYISKKSLFIHYCSMNMYDLCTWRCVATYFLHVVHTSAATANTAGIIGGAVGGTVFLLITLCIIIWYVIHCHKKRKSTGNVLVMSSVTFHSPDTLPHTFELINTKTNVTETDLGMDASPCKW